MPHIAIFLLGIILAAVTTYSLIRLEKKVRGCRLRWLDRFAFSVLWMFTLLSWAFLYVVSIGPVVAVTDKNDLYRDATREFYAPVIWLHNHTPLEKPLEDYVEAWGWH